MRAAPVIPKRRPAPLTRTATAQAFALFATDEATANLRPPPRTLDGRPDGPARHAPKRQTERVDVLQPTLQLLRAHRVVHRRISTSGIASPHTASGFQASPHKGCPDILAALAPLGRLWGIETKAPKGTFSDDQIRWRTDHVAAGALWTAPRSLTEATADLAFALAHSRDLTLRTTACRRCARWFLTCDGAVRPSAFDAVHCAACRGGEA